jgi:hypothetical protein
LQAHSETLAISVAKFVILRKPFLQTFSIRNPTKPVLYYTLLDLDFTQLCALSHLSPGHIFYMNKHILMIAEF